jgi:PAS domain S-box-containing protein
MPGELETDALLNAFLAGAPVGLAFLDGDFRFVRVNEHLARMTGRPVEEHVGRTLREVIGEFADRLEPVYRKVMESGEPVPDFDIRSPLPDDPGEVRHWRASYYPVRDREGNVAGVGVVVADMTERRRQEARLRAQYAVQRALTEADSLESAAPRILAAVCDTLGWDVGAMWLVDEESAAIRCLEVYRRPGLDADAFDAATRSASFPQGVGIPGRVWAGGEPTWVEDVTTDRNFPRAAAAEPAKLHGALAFPIKVGADVVGVLEFFSRRVRRPDPELLELVGAIGGQVGQFVRRSRVEQERTDLLAAERSARQEAEAAGRQLEIVQRITEAALAHSSLDDLLDDILPRLQEEFGADEATFLLMTDEGDALTVRAATGRETEEIESLRIPVGEGVAGRIAAERKALVTEFLRELSPVSTFLEQQMRSLMGVPVEVGDRVIGVLHVATKERRTFTDDDVALLQLLADRVALAVDQANLYEGEQLARRQAEHAAERTAALQRVTSSLAEALSPSDVARIIVEQGCATTGASSAWVALLDEPADKLDLLVESGYDPDIQAAFASIRLDADLPLAEAVRSGKPIFLGSREVLVKRYPGLADVSDRLGRIALAALPLATKGRRFGGALFGFPGVKAFDAEERRFLRGLAQQCALALERSQLYRERDYIARTLQQALLPPELPAIPGMEVAARYLPAGEGNEVGGDFYDVFWSLGGWGLLVGDVRGKGPGAAAVMGMIRHSIRAAALQERLPSGILRVVNDALRQQPGEDRFATLTYVRLEAAGAGVQATVCAGGHPLPLLLQRDGTVRNVGHPGMLLGPFPDPQLADHRAALSPGDTLVLYTDGVTERRGGESLFGEARLMELIHGCAGLSASEIVKRIEREVLAFGPEEPRDDIAILATRVTDWGVAAEPPR